MKIKIHGVKNFSARTQVYNSSNKNRRIKKRYHLRLFGYRISLVSLILLLFLCSILYNVIYGLYGLTMNYSRLAESKRILEEKNRMKEALEDEKVLWQTDEALEEEARKLGLIKEGEIIFLEMEPLQEE